MILAETIIRDRGPLAHLLLADPDVSAANRGGLATNLDEGMAIVPVIAADVVAESLFVTSTTIDRELELLSKPNATFLQRIRPQGYRTKFRTPRRRAAPISRANTITMAVNVAGMATVPDAETTNQNHTSRISTMMSNSKYDPGAGQALPRETRYIAPSAAAREAAPTRRDERAEREEEHRRRSFLVTNGEDWRQWYGPTLFEILDGVPDLFEPTRDFTTDDVVADVVRRFDLPSMDDVDFDGDEEDGFAGQDVAIWRDGKVLAVVRRGADGRPEATRFDAAADATEWGSMTSDRPPGRGGSEASDPIRAKLRRLRHRLGAIDRRHDERSGA